MTLRQLMTHLTTIAARCGVDLPVLVGVPMVDGQLCVFGDLVIDVTRDAPDAPPRQIIIFQPPSLAGIEPEGEA